MKNDNFVTVEINDKVSRVSMMVFAGIVLGTVLAMTFYNLFLLNFDYTIFFLVLYIIIFSAYTIHTTAKCGSSHLEIYKDKLAFIIHKPKAVPQRREIAFDSIKSYKISILTDKKNENKENLSPNAYNLRVFGLETSVETYDGENILISDHDYPRALIYSPSYIFRMLDVKRYRENFPLEILNATSKRDTEDFALQFLNYEKTGSNLSFFKNKKYACSLIKYTVLFTIVSMFLAFIVAYFLLESLNDIKGAALILTTAIGTLLVICIPMFMFAILTSFAGARANKKYQKLIEDVLKD